MYARSTKRWQSLGLMAGKVRVLEDLQCMHDFCIGFIAHMTQVTILAEGCKKLVS